MANYDVRVFEVPQVPPGVKFDPAKHKPRELSPATVKGSTAHKAKDALRARFEREGRSVRSINIGPDQRTGATILIAYLHGEVDGSA